MKNCKYLIVLLVILCLVSSGCSSKKIAPKKEEKVEKTVEKEEEYSFYKKENEERYQLYQQKYPELSRKDVILRVNIGLDYEYYTHTREVNQYLNTPYLLVNKYYSFGEYVPNDLEELSTEYSKGGIFLVLEAKDAFYQLVDAAKEDGYTIRAISAYRSYDYQVSLYQRYVDQDGVDGADQYSARPGFSEHQSGLCVDVDNRNLVYTSFADTKEFSWMQENAYRYGFILRYPEGKNMITGYQYEAWHYRYVGKEIAQYIHDHPMTFDEYYMEFLDEKR